MALLNAKSLEISKLDAMLVAEQAKTEALSIEMDVLQAELVTARNGPRPPEAHLGLELTEARKALVQEGADWEAERNTMLASIEELKRAKENAQNDRDFFRDQYGQASAFVSSVRKENDELEARAKTAEGQAKTGVEMVKATFVQRVRWLEDDARTWRQTAQHLMEMDKRTRGEELRKRAGEAPELRKKCDDLEERNELLCERLEELEGELDAKVRQEGVKELEEQLVQSRNEEGAWQMELESWRNETLRLNVELNEMKAELERVKADVGGGKEASPGDYGMVYRCQWRPEGSNDACEGLFLNIEVCFAISTMFHEDSDHGIPGTPKPPLLWRTFASLIFVYEISAVFSFFGYARRISVLNVHRMLSSNPEFTFTFSQYRTAQHPTARLLRFESRALLMQVHLPQA